MKSIALAVALLGAPTCLVEYTVGAPSGTSDGTCPAGQVVCGDTCAAPDACPCEQGCDRDLEVCEDDACRCRPGLVRCGAACVDPRADAAHCGGCDSPCADDLLCQAGECVAQCDDRTACSGACVDLSTDALHCDECARRCRSDELCTGGDCRPYVPLTDCATCPCPESCDDDGVCCDAPFLGGPVCIEGSCS